MWMLKVLNFLLDMVVFPIALLISICNKAKEQSRKIDIKLDKLMKGK